MNVALTPCFCPTPRMISLNKNMWSAACKAGPYVCDISNCP